MRKTSSDNSFFPIIVRLHYNDIKALTYYNFIILSIISTIINFIPMTSPDSLYESGAIDFRLLPYSGKILEGWIHHSEK